MVSGTTPRPRVVLLVDNDSGLLKSSAGLLEQQGYTVITAISANEALEVAKKRWLHLVVIDGRLKDEDDEEDFSGVDLAQKEALQTYPRIIYTAWLPHVAEELIRRNFGELGPGISILSKIERSVVDIVDQAFELPDPPDQLDPKKVCINFNQELIYTDRPSTLSLISLLDWVPNKSIQLLEWVSEMEDLFGKAFADRDRLAISLFSQGRSGGIVLLVTPQKNGEYHLPMIVKCGERRKILAEYRNYRAHVRNFLDWVTRLEGNPVETLHFGLLRYLITNGNIEETSTFADFYQRHDTDAVNAAIRHLFSTSLAPWHSSSNRSERRNPTWQFYEDRLLFGTHDALIDPLKRWMDIRPVITAVSARPTPSTLVKEQVDRLYWSFNHRTLDLPDPHAYLSRVRAGASKLFPLGYWACRSHGDLHVHNIRVDENSRTWLIDFEHTDWGPPLQDAVELESAIRYGLIVERQIERLFVLEEALANQPDLDQQPQLPDELNDRGELVKAFHVVIELRRVASQIEGARLADYLLGLTYQAIRIIRGRRPPSWADVRQLGLYHIHALFVASICCWRLEQLEAVIEPKRETLEGGYA